MVCEITWHMVMTFGLEEFENSVGTNVMFKEIHTKTKQAIRLLTGLTKKKHRHAIHARVIFFGWEDYLKHCKCSTFLQKERRVLTRKRTKMSNYLTHRYFVVDYVCCANKCNQK